MERKVVSAKHGVVATSQPLASETGLEILKQGGSAIDAAIASNAVLGLVEPHMCGMGGDLFAIVWDAGESRLHGLNASGRSPQSLSYSLLKNELAQLHTNILPTDSLLSVSVPGAVDGWFKLHERFGRLPFSALIDPVIQFAREGFDLTPVIAAEWNRFSAKTDEAFRGDFLSTYRPHGTSPAVGDKFRNPDLADSYSLIRESGRQGFYEGALAERIADFMKSQGGYIRKADLMAHQSDWVEPLCVRYRGCDIYELPPNGQGMAALQMFLLLEEYDIASMSKAEAAHVMVEAKKLAFEDRARFYSDPDFCAAPLKELLSAPYSEERRKYIGEEAAQIVYAGDPVLRQSDTVYLTTADSEGNMVSLIQSIFHPFGAGIVVPGTGFSLQNRGMSFSLDKNHANVYEAGKRPFQTIIPAFAMQNGEPYLSFGVMGGDMQPQGHVQVISNILDRDMDIQSAGDTPRWRHDGSTLVTDDADAYLSDGGELILESGVDSETEEQLRQRGHRVSRDDQGPGFGGYQAIMRCKDGSYVAASESRKDGCALGY